MKKVAIVQRRLTHYRVPLFNALKNNLENRKIQLKLLVGLGTEAEEKKKDAGYLPWAKAIKTHYWLKGNLCWQPLNHELKDIDLLIITQENKLLQNHLLMLTPRKFKIAFWGHGANLQSDKPRGFKERFKRWTTNQVDWWFAYTKMSADLVGKAGFQNDRITVLNNAIDTIELQSQLNSITHEDKRAIRESLGFISGPLGVFVGSLYSEKRLDFLLDAAAAIRIKIPDFQLLILGEGTEREKVQAWCSEHPWARWVGAKFGREKALHMSIAQIMLNPGMVGLGILDSFVCGLPMVTTDCGIHSPEISYLDHGKNGLITQNNLTEYVNAVLNLLNDTQTLEALQKGCFASACDYTVERMASRFAEGIQKALKS